MKAYNGKLLPLFAVDPAGKLYVFTAEEQLRPEADWKMASLVDETSAET